MEVFSPTIEACPGSIGCNPPPFVRKALAYLWEILLYVSAISLLTVPSLQFTGHLNFLAYRKRQFLVGMGITFIAEIVGLAAGFSERSFGIPAIIRRYAKARRLMDNFAAYRAEVEKR